VLGSQELQFRTMWDDIYERLKPEIQNGSIVVERGKGGTAVLSPAGSHIVRHEIRAPSTAQVRIDSTQPLRSAGLAPDAAPLHADAPADEYIRVRLSDRVLFESGDDRISEEGITVLARLGAILKDEANIQIAIQGHTDNKPIRDRLRHRFADNRALSQARASNASSILERSGVPLPWLSLQWFGESRPIAANDSEDSRRKNRRVEILITPKESR
jgi:flagellar motor protein MotB